jgi:hypothetical protein
MAMRLQGKTALITPVAAAVSGSLWRVHSPPKESSDPAEVRRLKVHQSVPNLQVTQGELVAILFKETLYVTSFRY